MTTQLAPPHVSDLMSTPVLTVETGETLWDAWQLMFVSGIRHLVVVDHDGNCIGTMSDRNVIVELPATPEDLGARLVGEVVRRTPELRITPTDDPRRAAHLMSEFGVEAVPVIDVNERLVGIVTESDVVRWVVS